MSEPTWMPAPQENVACPKGLEYLVQIDQLIVQQKVELLEAFTGFETSNKYVVKNTLGQQVYYAAEKSGCLERQCCTLSRAFEVHIVDNSNEKVMVLKRPRHCCRVGGCVGCTTTLLAVEAPPGNVIGYVKTDGFCLKPTYTVMDANLTPVMKKNFSGLAKEIFTDTDNFSVSFPMDLDVKVKASLLAALFLIDMNHFETSGETAGAAGVEGCLCLMLNIICS